MSEPVSIPAGQPTPEVGVEPQDIDTPALMVWGFISVVITVGVMLFAAALAFQAQNRLDEERLITPSYFDSDKVLSDQEAVLTSYGRPAAEGEPYKIPIDEAKDLVLEEWNSPND